MLFAVHLFFIDCTALIESHLLLAYLLLQYFSILSSLIYFFILYQSVSLHSVNESCLRYLLLEVICITVLLLLNCLFSSS